MTTLHPMEEPATYTFTPPAGYTAPACWCRNCDHAAKAGLSPSERIRAGSRFIVCPDCGNKRCPKGTNHELACTNSNESGQKGSEWENVAPWPKSADTPTPPAAPAPPLLSAARLAEIAAEDALWQPRPGTPRYNTCEQHRGELLAHIAFTSKEFTTTGFPALLSPARLAALADALAEERQGCDSEPANPMGFWPTAVAELLGHADALAGRVKEERAEADQFQVQVLKLVRRELDLLRQVAELKAQLKPEPPARDLLCNGDCTICYCHV